MLPGVMNLHSWVFVTTMTHHIDPQLSSVNRQLIPMSEITWSNVFTFKPFVDASTLYDELKTGDANGANVRCTLKRTEALFLISNRPFKKRLTSVVLCQPACRDTKVGSLAMMRCGI